MIYLIVIFLLILIIGFVANRELARDKKRINNMVREYSYKTYSPENEGKKHFDKEEDN